MWECECSVEGRGGEGKREGEKGGGGGCLGNVYVGEVGLMGLRRVGGGGLFWFGLVSKKGPCSWLVGKVSDWADWAEWLV